MAALITAAAPAPVDAEQEQDWYALAQERAAEKKALLDCQAMARNNQPALVALQSKTEELCKEVEIMKKRVREHAEWWEEQGELANFKLPPSLLDWPFQPPKEYTPLLVNKETAFKPIHKKARNSPLNPEAETNDLACDLAVALRCDEADSDDGTLCQEELTKSEVQQEDEAACALRNLSAAEIPLVTLEDLGFTYSGKRTTAPSFEYPDPPERLGERAGWYDDNWQPGDEGFHSNDLAGIEKQRELVALELAAA